MHEGVWNLEETEGVQIALSKDVYGLIVERIDGLSVDVRNILEVAALVAPDNVDSQEEEIFAAVLGWVKKDNERRATELDRLLPLVRFPLMREHATAMMTEPLVQPTCWRRSRWQRG